MNKPTSLVDHDTIKNDFFHSAQYYVRIARPDHWFKNIFIIPGVIIASIYTHTSVRAFLFTLIIGVISVCLVASANYVMNEWLDADFDRFHPVKKNRPSVTGMVQKPWVWVEYTLLALFGVSVAVFVSREFFFAALTLLIMGIVYNVEPLRTKDRVYLDVITESFNNALRLVLGWFIVTATPIPPASLVFGYWMAGAFLMGVKRFAEYRFIGDVERAVLYRRSFRFYTQERLLISIFFYSLCSAFFIGIFLIKYRIELLLSFPFIALLFSWYLHIGFQVNSSAQEPEYLFREKLFFLYTLFVAIVTTSLFFVDIPWANWFLKNSFLHQ